MKWCKLVPPPVLLQKGLFCGHAVNRFVKLTQLKYHPSESPADHCLGAGHPVVMVQRCLSQRKGSTKQGTSRQKEIRERGDHCFHCGEAIRAWNFSLHYLPLSTSVAAGTPGSLQSCTVKQGLAEEQTNRCHQKPLPEEAPLTSQVSPEPEWACGLSCPFLCAPMQLVLSLRIQKRRSIFQKRRSTAAHCYHRITEL